MADTTTPVYSFVLPEIDGSDGTWGTKLNANLTALDGLLSGSANLQNASFTGTASFGGSTGTAGQVLKSQGAGANAIWTDDSNTTYTAGSGLSLTGTEFANTAPDQTVVMNAGSGISVSGTYPTFTVTNSSPDQTVGLTGTGGTTISGTYPNFTINSTDNNTTYTAGTGLTLTSTEFSVTDNGIGALQLNVSGNGTNGQVLASDGDGSFSWTSAQSGGNETLAQTLALGAVTGGTDISVSSGDNIVMAASSTVDGRDLSVDGTKLDGIEANADVTDTANVTAAGALMDSELTSEASVKALDQGVATTDSPTFAAINVNGLVTSDDFQIDLGTTTAAAEITTPSSISGFQALRVRNTHTDGTLAFGTTLGQAKIQAYGANGSADPLNIDVGSITAIGIDATGKVGIGTTSPTELLHVTAAINPKILVKATGAGDADADIVLDANDTGESGVLFHNAGTQKARLDWSNQNSQLNLATESGTDGTIDFQPNDTLAMRILADGKVGIGTGTPAQALTVNGTDARIYLTGANTDIDMDASANGQLSLDGSAYGFGIALNGDGAQLYTNSASRDLIFGVNETEMGRITDTEFLFGKTSTSYATVGSRLRTTGVLNLTTNGASALVIRRNNLVGNIQSFYRGSTVVGSISVSQSSTSYNTSSDYRLKENVVELTGATDRLKQLNPSRFNFIEDADTTVDGFLAHEVADVVPEAVTGEKDAMMEEEYEVTPEVLDEEGNTVEEAVMGTRSVPDYQGIDQSKLVPLLVATIQELEARITQLENS